VISLVLPCFNEESVLPEACRQLTDALVSLGEPWEVIIVDDGSTDGSREFLRGMSRQDSRWKAVFLSRNFGQQAALSCGLDAASGGCVILMDLDMQDPPSVIHRFIAEWKRGYRVVYAVRMNRQENILKRTLYFLFYRFLSLVSDIDIPLDAGDFCLMDREVVDVIKRLPERNRFLRGLRVWAGFPQMGVEYDRPSRLGGAPKYNASKLISLALDGLFSFSKKPLRFIALLGIIISAFSFLGTVFFILNRILNFTLFGFPAKNVPGTATIVVAVLFIGGMQLVCLSIIGEYLGRVFDETKGRPNWVVESRLGFDR
jgi:dolichol-phosphate mannosyltransferase